MNLFDLVPLIPKVGDEVMSIDTWGKLSLCDQITSADNNIYIGTDDGCVGDLIMA